MVMGAPLEDARHLAQRYDRMRQEAEAQVSIFASLSKVPCKDETLFITIRTHPEDTFKAGIATFIKELFSELIATVSQDSGAM